jgi:hypothetical protein
VGQCSKKGLLLFDFACHPCTGTMLIFSVCQSVCSMLGPKPQRQYIVPLCYIKNSRSRTFFSPDVWRQKTIFFSPDVWRNRMPNSLKSSQTRPYPHTYNTPQKTHNRHQNLLLCSTAARQTERYHRKTCFLITTALVRRNLKKMRHSWSRAYLILKQFSVSTFFTSKDRRLKSHIIHEFFLYLSCCRHTALDTILSCPQSPDRLVSVHSVAPCLH